MRIVLLSLSVLLILPCIAQDKNLLQKQITEIMTDFPNKFKNLRDQQDSFFLKFIISGTPDRAFMMINEKNMPWGYITAPLPIPRSDTQARELYDKWVALISSVTLNGAALSGKTCDPGKFGIHCYEWRIDNSKNDIAPAYSSFTIKLSVLKINSSFAGDLKFGDL